MGALSLPPVNPLSEMLVLVEVEAATATTLPPTKVIAIDWPWEIYEKVRLIVKAMLSPLARLMTPKSA